MTHEESFLDYDKGFRVGTFDKCNGRPSLDALELFARGKIWADGYEDGYTGNEQQIGPSYVQEDIENFFGKLETEGDLLYVLENWPDVVPDDIWLRRLARRLTDTAAEFKRRLSEIAAEVGVEEL